MTAAELDPQWVEEAARALVADHGDDWSDPPVYPGGNPEAFRDDYRRVAARMLGGVAPLIAQAERERIAAAIDAECRLWADGSPWGDGMERAAQIARWSAATSGCVDGGSKTTPEATPAAVPQADEPNFADDVTEYVEAHGYMLTDWQKRYLKAQFEEQGAEYRRRNAAVPVDGEQAATTSPRCHLPVQQGEWCGMVSCRMGGCRVAPVAS